ncbi:MAG: insulinase family protein [Spirochaetia bacterium]|nr:insulinase family protein [Spirochaetia bacterium]
MKLEIKNTIKIISVSVAVLFILYSGRLLAINNKGIEKIQKEFDLKTKKYVLNNGIRVILFQNKISPTIASYIKIGVGSANEPFDQAGTAHFLEHLLFKGTKVIGTSDFEKEKPYLDEIAKLGNEMDLLKRQIDDPLTEEVNKKSYIHRVSEIQKKMKTAEEMAGKYIISEEDSKVYSYAGQVGYNAYTTNDVTNYQIKLPKNRLELWSFMESSRFIDPVFREFYQEREVIQEERKMRYDSNPQSLLYELFNSTAFGMSPYGKPVIGYANNIPNLTLNDTQNFYNTYYIPSRMVIAISGDIEFDETIKIIKKYFERIPDRPDSPFPPIKYVMPLGRKTAELVAENTPFMITGWYKPSLRHPDNPIYEVLSRILADGQNSRLVNKLVIQDKLAQSVSVYSGVPSEKLENQFAIFVAPYKEESYEKIYDLLKLEVADIAKNGVTEQEITRVKNRIYKEMVDSLNSNAGMADLMSYYELMMQDYKYLFTYFDAIQSITSQDIQRVAKATFIEKNNTTVWIKKPEK